MNNQVSVYIESAADEQKEIMNIVRAIIHSSVPNVVEEFKWSRPMFKSTVHFAYLQANKHHVTVGITKDFEKIDDPTQKLEGTGKGRRHIKVKSVAEINQEELKEWFTLIA